MYNVFILSFPPSDTLKFPNPWRGTSRSENSPKAAFLTNRTASVFVCVWMITCFLCSQQNHSVQKLDGKLLQPTSSSCSSMMWKLLQPNLLAQIQARSWLTSALLKHPETKLKQKSFLSWTYFLFVHSHIWLFFLVVSMCKTQVKTSF